MTQPTLVKDLVTYTLPYPQTYTESQATRSADFNSYTGIISRDYPANAEKYPLYIFVGWEELDLTDAGYINDVWIAMMIDIDAQWVWTDPGGTARYAWINPDQPNIQLQRYSDGDANVKFNIRLSFFTEDI